MLLGLRNACVLLIGCALAFAVAAAESNLRPIPALSMRVTDITGTLAAPQQKLIEDRLAALEQHKGTQVAVLIVPTTAPESIEQYSTRVFDAWKLGRKNVNDGVLVVIAKDDHRVRIEVAYGLEGAIPDAAAFRIEHEYMTPKFRDGDFAGGIGAGIDMLTRLIDEEPLPPPQPQALRQHSLPIPEPWWSPVQFVVGILFGGILGVIVVLVLSRPRVYRLVLGRVPARARTFAIGVITAVPITVLMRHPMAALGAMAAGSSLSAIAGLSKTPRPSRRSGGSGGGGGSSGGGSSDSGSSSSSSSGSDFSGGGGSSGGGGASDSW
jgi:uncharacterized protein